MHRTNSFATCLCSAAAVGLISASCAGAAPQAVDVMPAPTEVHVSAVRIGVSGSELVLGWAHPPDERLKAAAETPTGP